MSLRTLRYLLKDVNLAYDWTVKMLNSDLLHKSKYLFILFFPRHYPTFYLLTNSQPVPFNVSEPSQKKESIILAPVKDECHFGRFDKSID